MKRIMLFMFAAVLCCGIQSLNAGAIPNPGCVSAAAGDLPSLYHCLDGKGPKCSAAMDTFMTNLMTSCCQDGTNTASACVINMAAVIEKVTSYIPSVFRSAVTPTIYSSFCNVGCSAKLCSADPYIAHSCLYFCDPTGNMQNCFTAASGSMTQEVQTFIKNAGLGGMAQYLTTDPGPRAPVLRGVHWYTDKTIADCWQSQDACDAANKAQANSCDPDWAKKCCTDKDVCKWDEPAPEPEPTPEEVKGAKKK